jgi:hypothetical protein
MMISISTRSLVTSIFLALFSLPLIYAQDLSKYREFQLGMNLDAVAKKADVDPSAAKVIYQRPAVIQELEWWPHSSSNSPDQPDPVNEILFSFYNGQLYRIVIRYDQQRTKGLTDQDLIESISAKYGKPTMPDEKIISSPSSQFYSDSENVIACWESSQYSIYFFRFSYGPAPGMLVVSKRLEALAQVAIVQAVALNAQEAPQREIESQKQQDEEKSAAEQKARPLSKANFRP